MPCERWNQRLLCQRRPRGGFVTPAFLAPQSRGAEITNARLVFLFQEGFACRRALPQADRPGQILRRERVAVEWKVIPVSCLWAWEVKGFIYPG